MKYLTILLSIFAFMSCGNSKNLSAMDNNKQAMEEISGIFYVTSINEIDYSSNKLTLQFDSITKIVSGFSGCNRFTGNYKIDGNTIVFGPLASTRMMCPENENKMEQNMFSALNSVNFIAIKNQELTLSKNGTILIIATKNKPQDSNYIIEYTAVSRGLFHQYVFENGNLSVQKDRTSLPTIITCSDEEITKLLDQVKALDLKTLSTLEAPTEKRFYDGAAIATLKIIYNGETYQTPEFDNGEPNKYIASLVSTFLELAEK